MLILGTWNHDVGLRWIRIRGLVSLREPAVPPGARRWEAHDELLVGRVLPRLLGSRVPRFESFFPREDPSVYVQGTSMLMHH